MRSPQTLERVGQAAQRGLCGAGPLSVQRRMAARWAGAEELAGHQRITARRDGFRPVAGGAGIGGGLGADGHGGLFLQRLLAHIKFINKNI